MIRYANRKLLAVVEHFWLTDGRLKCYSYVLRVDVLSRGQATGKKIGETKTKPPRTPRSAF